MTARAKTALVLLNVSALLIVSGGLYDLLTPGLPPHQLEFLGVEQGELNSRFVTLYLAVFRALGGCLIAIGVTAFVLINKPFREGQRWSGWALAALIGIGEGINMTQMYTVGSPWWAPLVFIALLALGLALASLPSPVFQGQS